MHAESEDKYLEKIQFYQARSMEYKCEWIEYWLEELNALCLQAIFLLILSHTASKIVTC